METPHARNCAPAAALGLIGMCVALACAHGEEARPAGPLQSVEPEQGKQHADSGSPSSCGDPSGPGPSVAFRWPANGEVTSGFGRRGEKTHRGIDISGYYGAAVRAAAPGEVVFSERKRGYGRVVILKHPGGYETVYAHLQDNFVLDGAHIRQGQVIADMGSSGASSGPHLHFEVRFGKRAVDPLACLPSRTAKRP